MLAKKYEAIAVEKDHGITWLMINRPDKRNAMSPQAPSATWTRRSTSSPSIPRPKFWCSPARAKGVLRRPGHQALLPRQAGDAAARHKLRRASNNWRWQKLSTFPKPTIAMVNGYCFGGAFTQVCACDFALAADDAMFGLSEVNWGILPGGIVSWNVAQTMNYRDALYYAMTGDTFDGKQAKQMGFVNFSYPKERLREETVKLGKKLMEKSPATLRYTKEAIRAVRFMNEPQAQDYLAAKSDALRYNDKENSREEGMKQFLDEKTYRPGYGHFKRKRASA